MCPDPLPFRARKRWRMPPRRTPSQCQSAVPVLKLGQSSLSIQILWYHHGVRDVKGERNCQQGSGKRPDVRQWTQARSWYGRILGPRWTRRSSRRRISSFPTRRRPSATLGWGAFGLAARLHPFESRGRRPSPTDTRCQGSRRTWRSTAGLARSQNPPPIGIGCLLLRSGCLCDATRGRGKIRRVTEWYRAR